MAVVGPDLRALLAEGKPRLFPVGDHALQQGPIDRPSLRTGPLEERVHVGPAARIEAEPERIGIVAEHVAQKLTRPNDPVLHAERRERSHMNAFYTGLPSCTTSEGREAKGSTLFGITMQVRYCRSKIIASAAARRGASRRKWAWN